MPMLNSQDQANFWHTRYRQQATWTAPLRAYLLARANFAQALRVLDVGCGTGVLLAELSAQSPGGVYGMDIDPQALKLAMRSSASTSLSCADALRLPYAPAVFDIVLCHFVLLWLADPLRSLLEMARVSRSGGAILALAEPDYGGRIDFPPELESLGHLQTKALRAQGADPYMGRKLPGLFHQAGFAQVESGVFGAQWISPPAQADRDLEWQVLQQDLNRSSELGQSSEEYRQKEEAAWQRGERVLYVPTFYAWGVRL